MNIHEAYIKFLHSIEKSIGSTKQGLGAFKRGPDGSFYNAFDSINESYKIIEDAIASTGINSDGKKHFKIGVNVDGQSFYVEDANKYEWDGPKG